MIKPPRRNKAPMPKANFILELVAIAAAMNAPIRVPKAWAKNGNIKCFQLHGKNMKII